MENTFERQKVKFSEDTHPVSIALEFINIIRMLHGYEIIVSLVVLKSYIPLIVFDKCHL